MEQELSSGMGIVTSMPRESWWDGKTGVIEKFREHPTRFVGVRFDRNGAFLWMRPEEFRVTNAQRG